MLWCNRHGSGGKRARLQVSALKPLKGSVTRSDKSQRHVAGTCRPQRVTRSDKARRKQVAKALIRAWSHELSDIFMRQVAV